jgi:plasmid stabilization system protein ParE
VGQKNTTPKTQLTSSNSRSLTKILACYYFLYLQKTRQKMKLQLEIQSESDLKLFLSLAQRLKIKANKIDETQLSNYQALSWQQVSDRLEIKPQFQQNLKAIIDYIRLDSVQNSEKFKKEIVTLIYKISQHPESYSIQHKVKTKYEYRYAVFKKSYHIYFRISEQVITIVDILHVRRNPLKIKSFDKI